MKEHIIYQTMGFDTRTEEELRKDFEESLCDDYDDLTEEQIAEAVKAGEGDLWSEHFQTSYNNWFRAEQDNLSVELDEKIIAIASMGLWNGRRNGYKELSYNLKDIFTVWDSCDDIKLYADQYNVRGEGHHHDGRNYVTFRRWANDVSDENKERTLNALYYEKDEVDKLIKRFTRSIRPDVKKIYGW